MLIVETIGRIRREHLGKGKSIKEISRTLHLSRITAALTDANRPLPFGSMRPSDAVSSSELFSTPESIMTSSSSATLRTT